MCSEIAGTVWKQNVGLADKANEPGKFTAFCSYEWTSMPNNMNLHRNIFFKDCAKVPPMPFSALDSSDPEDLWNWMDGQRKAGNELLAISHNANLSDGRMYPTEVDLKGRPIDAAYAESRMRNEPLIEIKQIKGHSETHPLLSPNDEFANFEIISYLLGDPAGRIPHIVGSYARQALKDGLATARTPRASTPTSSVSAPPPTRTTPPSPIARTTSSGPRASPTERSRRACPAHLFAGMDAALGGHRRAHRRVGGREHARLALRRHEAQGDLRRQRPAHQGALLRRLGVRRDATAEQRRAFWKNVPDWIKDRDWVKTAYAQGVPMGGDLPPASGHKAPTFVVWAVKDPTSGNLDRIQIVKGWTKSGQSFEKDLRRRLGGRPQARQVDRRRAADRKHGRRRKGHVHEHHRRGRTEDRVDRSRVRSERSRRSTTPACSRSRRRAGRRSRPSSSASRRPTSWRQPLQERAWSSPDLVHAEPSRRGKSPRTVPLSTI